MAEKTDRDVKQQIADLLDSVADSLLDGDLSLPMIKSWVLVVAIDDAQCPGYGGHVLFAPECSLTYEVKGLLSHGIKLADDDAEDEGE